MIKMRYHIVALIFSREDKLVERAKALKVSAGIEPDADLGPVISKQVSVQFKNLCASVLAPSILAISLSTIKYALFIETADLVLCCLKRILTCQYGLV